MKNIFIALMMGLLFTLNVQAERSSFWTTDSKNDFDSGKSEGVSILPSESITLAPTVNKVLLTGQTFIWDMASNSRGDIFLATGHEGQILKYSAEGITSEVADLEAPEVIAVAVDAKDNLYFATGPRGAVYVKKGAAEPVLFWDPAETYIWDMIFDRSGNLYAAVGSKGKVYRVNSQGKASIVLDTKEDHIISLALDMDGKILAGSSGNALIYEIDPSTGAVRIIYDSSLNDIRSILVDSENNIFAAAFDLKSAAEQMPQLVPQSRGKKEDGNDSSDSSKDKNGEDDKADSEARQFIINMVPGMHGPVANSEIYFFDRDRFGGRVWSGSSEAVMAMGLTTDNKALFVAGSKDSKLYTVDRWAEQTTLAEFDSNAQVTAFLNPTKLNKTLIATGNLGELFELSHSYGQSGEYTSKVFNAGLPAMWGKIEFTGDNPSGTSVTFLTRCGNTTDPDTTWSRWQAPVERDGVQKISSPVGQYFQWKAILKTSNVSKTPLIEQVSVSFLRRNQPPRISRIRLLPPGLFIKKAPSPPSDHSENGESIPADVARIIQGGNNNKLDNPFQGKKEYQSGMQMAGWNAEDANDDKLSFLIQFRGENERNWRNLKKNSADNFVMWDTHTMADGKYRLRVVADDSLDNPQGRAHTFERVSEYFLVDNTSPVISNISITPKDDHTVTVSFKVSDTVSDIDRVEASIDAGAWQEAFPVDMITDSKSENFQFDMKVENRAGEHTVSVRAMDQFHNVDTKSKTVRF